MTHEQKIQFIADKCAIANPRLKDLTLGCRFKFETPHSYGEGMILNESSSFNGEYLYYTFGMPNIVNVKHITEIIGREPQLADVLMAINKFEKTGNILLDDKGNFLGDNNIGEPLISLSANWSLTQGLYNQSPECIEFLYQLLSK